MLPEADPEDDEHRGAVFPMMANPAPPPARLFAPRSYLAERKESYASTGTSTTSSGVNVVEKHSEGIPLRPGSPCFDADGEIREGPWMEEPVLTPSGVWKGKGRALSYAGSEVGVPVEAWSAGVYR